MVYHRPYTKNPLRRQNSYKQLPNCQLIRIKLYCGVVRDSRHNTKGANAVASKKQIAEIEAIIEAMSLAELVALRSGLDERITALQDVEKDKLVANFREQAIQLGLNLGDLATALGIQVARRTGSLASAGDGRAKPDIRYRNPKNHNETWKSRGKRPSWLVRELAIRGLNENSEIPKEFHIENQ